MTGDVAKGEKGQGTTGGELARTRSAALREAAVPVDARRQGALRLYLVIFRSLGEVKDIGKRNMSRLVRLGGFTEAMREHVPVLLAKLHERFPGLKVTLQVIDQRGAKQLIAQGEADLAIVVLESKLPPGFRPGPSPALPASGG